MIRSNSKNNNSLDISYPASHLTNVYGNYPILMWSYMAFQPQQMNAVLEMVFHINTFAPNSAGFHLVIIAYEANEFASFHILSSYSLIVLLLNTAWYELLSVSLNKQ
jgi:hypothetical protein